mmetsp:Transcript_46632/g.68922  ORF Transcript_46632/g.68922 Transcript_46632/m.68922 type:complete len:444 (+) Transcript_46632:321-1652(+)|eukprot:CAMPEP_0195509172 /NCGR_PEP_ID=MMETSP0794_2-20130614/2187_1 /TAXON_ID=515487 /ORGANISM="Stephanopyxis turris, Strain CCMP 815" /LENGTH=443 /DNA_ID=CAMNT_0040636333 /DNA_START=287 /DNA_END=1618 /DNA_ORIENTATION=+
MMDVDRDAPLLDPMNPPSGFPWHRWASNTINIPKFIQILETIGNGGSFPLYPNSKLLELDNDEVDDRGHNFWHHYHPRAEDENVWIREKHQPVIVRGGRVMRPQVAPYENKIHATILIEEAIELARYLQPHNPRMAALTEGDFPFLWDGYDYPFCGDDLVPIFRWNMFASNKMCNFSFPFVSGHLWIKHYSGTKALNPFFSEKGKLSRHSWFEQTREWDHIYPWESKQAKAVWRGTLTGFFRDKDRPRWKMVEKGMAFPSTMDIKFSGATQYIDLVHGTPQFVDHEEKNMAETIPKEDFMKYRAIIDIDGNGWSSRFCDLLCFNSVVIKVESTYQAYFEKDLKPMVHYIPVKADLSDLEAAISFAVSDEAQKDVRTIISNANSWCANNIIHYRMVTDFMWTLLAYAELLQGADGWYEQWKSNKIAYEWPKLKMSDETRPEMSG